MRGCPKTQRNPIALDLESQGFVIAGEMWGDAAWFRVDEGTIADIWNPETQLVPHDASAPCEVHVYRGPFHPEWALSEGEIPLPDDVITSMASLDRYMATVECADLASAVEFVRLLGKETCAA